VDPTAKEKVMIKIERVEEFTVIIQFSAS